MSPVKVTVLKLYRDGEMCMFFFTVWFVVYCLYVIYILYVYACIFNVSFIVFLAFIVLFTEVAIKKRHPENKKSEVIERVMWCQIKYGYGMLQLGHNE